MPISVGSIGDIIALAQVAGKLYKALRANRGSAAEFQDVVLELSTFYGTLERLLILWPNRPSLTSNIAILGPIVHECKAEIDAFLDKIILKYGRRLGAGVEDNSRRRKGFKEIGKMLQWSMFERGEVARLKEKVERANMMIQLAYSEAQGAAAEQDARIALGKMQTLADLELAAKENLLKHIVELQGSAARQEEILENHTVVLKDVSTDLRSVVATLTPMAEATFSMKSMLLALQQSVNSQESIPRSLDPWLEKALYLEDSLGHVLPIPLQTISSWEVLHAVLCDKFRDRPGYELVKRRRYIFQDGANGRDLSIKAYFTSVVRPGQRVTMCMVFFSPEEQKNVCPRCGTVTIAGENADVNCSYVACGMIYRRVIDVTESSPLQDQKGDLSPIHYGGETSSFLSEINDITASIPLLSYEDYNNSPDIFKRVRFFTRWQDSGESRLGDLFVEFQGVSLWKCTGPALEVTSQMTELLNDNLAAWGYVNYPEILPSLHDEDYTSLAQMGFCWNFFFLGTCRRKARPVLVIYSRDKEIRQEIAEFIATQEWLHPNKSGLVTTTVYNPFLRRAVIENKMTQQGWDRDFAEKVY